MKKIVLFIISLCVFTTFVCGQDDFGKVMLVNGNITYSTDSNREQKPVTAGMNIEGNTIFHGPSDNGFGSVTIYVYPEGMKTISRFPTAVSGEPLEIEIAGIAVNAIGGSFIGSASSSINLKSVDEEDTQYVELDSPIEAFSHELIRSDFAIAFVPIAREVSITEQSITIPLPVSNQIESISYEVYAVQAGSSGLPNDAYMHSSGELERGSSGWIYNFPSYTLREAENDDPNNNFNDLLLLTVLLSNGNEETLGLRYYVLDDALVSQVNEAIEQAKSQMDPSADTDILEALMLWNNGLTVEAIQFLQGKNKDSAFLLEFN